MHRDAASTQALESMVKQVEATLALMTVGISMVFPMCNSHAVNFTQIHLNMQYNTRQYHILSPGIHTNADPSTSSRVKGCWAAKRISTCKNGTSLQCKDEIIVVLLFHFLSLCHCHMLIIKRFNLIFDSNSITDHNWTVVQQSYWSYWLSLSTIGLIKI